MTNVQAEIRRAAQTARALHLQIHATFARRGESKEAWAAWEAACKAFRLNHNPALDLFWANEALTRLEAGDADLLELALALVEVNPHYFRSGYLKSRLYPRLRRMALPEKARARIRHRVLQAVRWREPHWEIGWKQMCRLVATFADAEFVSALEACAGGADHEAFVARRARWLLGYLRGEKR